MTAPATRGDRIADHLTQHTHQWTIFGVVCFAVAYYFLGREPALQTQEQWIGRITIFLVSSVGFTGGLMALIMMASLKSADFNRLERFQPYLILGVGISTFVTGTVVLHALRLIPFLPPLQ